jgi:cis-3-alkyl-4-acyloxetan-2-one decarboxylase
MVIPDWLQAEYPFSPRSFTTPRGAVMSYLDEGGEGSEGREAVLMLHGNPTWSFYYRRLVAALAPSIRCIAPDHVGMGLSAKPADYPYTLAQRIADLEALIAHLGLTRLHLVVHDWGGAIGAGVAGRQPERIGRIVVLNTGAWPSPLLPRRIAVCRWPWLGPLLVRGCNGFAGPAVAMAMARRRLTPVERRGYLWPYRDWASRVAINAFVRDIPMSPWHPTWTTLASVGQNLARLAGHPALIVWGGRDFCFNDHFYHEWRERWPLARAHHLADAGHYVLEDAHEEVVPLVSEFLRE